MQVDRITTKWNFLTGGQQKWPGSQIIDIIYLRIEVNKQERKLFEINTSYYVQNKGLRTIYVLLLGAGSH